MELTMRGTVVLAAWLLLGPASAASPDFVAQLRTACAAEVGARPAVDGIQVRALPPPAAGDLPGLRVTHAGTGAWMTVYYDAVSADAAWARAACLGGQIALLAEATRDERPDARWFSVVFTADPAYVPPRDGKDTRWTVPLTPGGRLSAASQATLLVVMPHEQVHAYQKRAGATTPRWFHEGHAEWLGRKVSEMVAPRLADENARSHEAALRASTTPVALQRWGGMRVKREAILRQLSEQDRKRLERDPGFSPPGPFKIGPGDMESDESNTAARYQAAWALFRDLEQAHGTAAVSAWVASVTRADDAPSSDQVAATANAAFGGDIAPRLR